MMRTVAAVVAAAVLPLALAQESSATCGPAPSGAIRPSVASGYHYQVVATGLARPRGIHFDNEGHLLVVESRSGGRVVAFTLDEDDNGCVTASEPKTVTDDADV
jgi:glucose/arabinose dehydrogenase